MLGEISVGSTPTLAQISVFKVDRRFVGYEACSPRGCENKAIYIHWINTMFSLGPLRPFRLGWESVIVWWDVQITASVLDMFIWLKYCTTGAT